VYILVLTVLLPHDTVQAGYMQRDFSSSVCLSVCHTLSCVRCVSGWTIERIVSVLYAWTWQIFGHGM